MTALRRPLLAMALVAAVGLGGCGAGSRTKGAGSGLTVSAASSLRSSFTAYASRLGLPVRFAFGGSDQLAAQLRSGVHPDVFASANTTLPEALHREGYVGPAAIFARNRLVVAIPAYSRKIVSLADLAKPGVTIALGSVSVPIGIYARRMLARLPHGKAAAILANVRSNEPDVAGIVGKLIEGAVDAGIVYATDVRAARGAIAVVPIPSSLQPSVSYAITIVNDTRHRAAAERFVRGLLGPAGRRVLGAAGFLAPA